MAKIQVSVAYYVGVHAWLTVSSGSGAILDAAEGKAWQALIGGVVAAAMAFVTWAWWVEE